MAEVANVLAADIEEMAKHLHAGRENLKELLASLGWGLVHHVAEDFLQHRLSDERRLT